MLWAEDDAVMDRGEVWGNNVDDSPIGMAGAVAGARDDRYQRRR